MRAMLYLMVGYPGAGKTTTARVIQQLTNTRHIWADDERRKMFDVPTHSPDESHILYKHLNQVTEDLLRHGTSVIFDTNFNFRRDRDRLRTMAVKHGAECQIIWVKVDKSLALHRASNDAHKQSTRVLGDMPPEAFERMTGNLQPPSDDEQPIILDGTMITPEYVAEKLGISRS